MFSPAYLRDRGPHPFSADLSLKWDWGGAKTFDVDTSPTQNMPLPYTFILAGENTEVHVRVAVVKWWKLSILELV